MNTQLPLRLLFLFCCMTSILLTACGGGGGTEKKAPTPPGAPKPPGVVSFELPSYTVTQGTSQAVLSVRRSSGGTAAISIKYATVDDSAVAGSDYTTKSGTLHWAEGDSSEKTIAIAISTSAPFSGTRSFSVVLSIDGNKNAGIATPDTATVAINGSYVPDTACGTATPAATALSTTFQFYDPINLSDADGLSEHPSIDVNPNGNGKVYVAWEDSGAGQKDILFRQSSDFGATYTSALTLSKSGTAVFPSIRTTPNGSIHVAWEDTVNGTPQIFYVRSTNAGSSFSATAVQLSTTAAQPTFGSTSVQLASDSSGKLYALWVDESTSLRLARSDDNGSSFSLVHTHTPSGVSPAGPSLTIDSNDHLHMAWSESTIGGTVRTIQYAQSSDEGVNWSAAIKIAQGNTLSQATVAADAANGFVYLAYRNEDAKEIYMTISSDAGQTFPAPFNFSNNAGTSLDPSLAVDSSGRLYIVWTDTTPGNYETVFSKSVDHGQTFIPMLNLAPSVQGSLFTAIAVDNNENVYAAWDDNRYPNSPNTTSNEGNFEILVAHGRPDLPAVLSAQASACPFSPNGDNVDDRTTFTASFSEPLNWTVDIYNSNGDWVHHAAVPSSAATYGWNGKQSKISGTPTAPDGTYDFVVSGTSVASSIPAMAAQGSLIINTVSDATAPQILSFAREAFAFSPNGDGFKDTDGISASFNKPVNWTLTITNTTSNEVVRTFTGSGLSIDPATIFWNGKNDAGTVQGEDNYLVKLSIQDSNGQTAECGPSPIVCQNMEIDVTKPQLSPIQLSGSSLNISLGESVRVQATPMETSLVTIYVYTSAGTFVREVDRNYHDAGVSFEEVWDGKNAGGSFVTPGTYTFYIWNRDRAGNTAPTYPYRLSVTVSN